MVRLLYYIILGYKMNPLNAGNVGLLFEFERPRFKLEYYFYFNYIYDQRAAR